MKRLSIIVLSLLCVLFLAASVSALTVSNVQIGNDDQMRGENKTVEVTITNDGASAVSSLAVSFTDLTGKSDSFNVTLSSLLVTSLEPGNSTKFTITSYVPLWLDAIDENYNEKIHDIGTLNVNGVDASSDAVAAATTVKMQAKNMLEIKDADVCVNDDCEDVDDGDDVKDVRPGDSVEVEVEVENLYNDNNDEDFEMDRVDIYVEIDDRDIDVDEDEDANGLGAEDEERVTLEFDVEDDADDKNYDMEIKVRGIDENDARHGEKWDVDFKVDRETHELLIKRKDIAPSVILCNDESRVAQLTVAIQNTGKRDENDAVIEVKSANLGINEKLTELELDEDDRQTKRFTLNIPEDAKAGKYNIEINSYYQDDRLSDSQSVELTIEECAAEEEEEEPTTVVVAQPTQPTQPTTTTTVTPTTVTPSTGVPTANTGASARVRDTTDKSFTDSGAYLALLIVIAAAVVLLIVLLVMRGVYKK